MIHDPEILILDEPTTGLDPNQIVEIRKLIRELGKEKTVILSTHILPEVEATCDRILIINKGQIVADVSADTLRKQAQGQEVLKVQIEDAPGKDEITSAISALETVAMVDPLPDTDNRFVINSRDNESSRRNVFNLCERNNWVLTEMTPMETKLEDIFRELTTK
jgi:ABC-2 type transport system ATP-binding protein